MKKTLIYILLPVLFLMINACDDNFEDINTDPNNPTDVSPDLLLTYGIERTMDQVNGPNVGLEIGNLVIQHWARISSTEKDRYIYSNSSFSGLWNSLYQGSLKDFQTIVEMGETMDNPNYKAVGLILKSYAFSIITDCFGDIPYTEALKGISEGIKFPQFDAQEVVYDGMIAELAEANQIIDPDGPAIKGDILFNNDLSKWQKLANALRLRLLMRISGKKDVAAQVSQIIENEPIMTSNDDNAMLVYLENPPNRNPFAELPQGRQEQFVMSNTLVNTLKDFNDSRLMVYADPTRYESANKPADSVYVGLTNGLLPDQAAAVNELYISQVGEEYRESTTPAILMSYPEVLFIMAEAAHKDMIDDDAAGLYEQAITASFDMHGATMDAGYLAQDGVAFESNNAMQQIGTQKWISLYTQGIEAWSEWRRLGYPELDPAVGNQNNDQIPVRLEYPQSEEISNLENYRSAIQNMGGNTLNEHVWWDQ